MTYKIAKPKGTFYTDYTIEKGFLYGIFEHDSRVSYIKMGRTEKTNQDWRTFDVQETENELIIKL